MGNPDEAWPTPSRGDFTASAAGFAIVAAAIGGGADFDPGVAHNKMKLAPQGHGLAQVFPRFLEGAMALFLSTHVPASY
jgi:hypothetical protein